MDSEKVVKVINDFSEYKKKKEEIEKTYFKLMSPACYGVEEEIEFINEKGHREKKYKVDLIKYNELYHRLRNIFCNVVQDGKNKKISFVNNWLSDPNIRTYNILVYKPPPQVVIEGEFNLYKAGEVQNMKKDEVKLVDITNYLEMIASINGRDDKCIKYFHSYVADMVQNPGRQGRSHGRAIISRGEQGNGRGAFYEIMKKILGYRNTNITSDIDSIVKSKDNRFASGAIDMILVCPNETSAKEGYSRSHLLKDYITAVELQKEYKGIDGIVIRTSYARFICFTNLEASFQIESSDRRYIIICSTDEFVGEAHQKFWTKMYADINDPNYIYSIYNYYKNLNIDDFDFSDRPITDAYHRAKANNIPYTIRFMSELDKRRYTMNELFEKFNIFMQENKFRFEMTKPSFTNEIKEYVKRNIGLYKVKNSTTKYYVDKIEFKKYCDKMKFNLFEDEEDEKETKPDDDYKFVKEEKNDLDHGVQPVKNDLQNENEQLKAEIKALKQELEKVKQKPKLTIDEEYIMLMDEIKEITQNKKQAKRGRPKINPNDISDDKETQQQRLQELSTILSFD